MRWQSGSVASTPALACSPLSAERPDSRGWTGAWSKFGDRGSAIANIADEPDTGAGLAVVLRFLPPPA